METKDELKKLENELREIRRTHKRNSSWLALITVIIVIFLIYLISFLIKIEIHDAIADENIAGLVETGFDRVMENYEVAE